MDIRSKSDSVVPGYLYQKLGDTNEIWNLLDGIFACIIYDGRYVLLQQAALGIHFWVSNSAGLPTFFFKLYPLSIFFSAVAPLFSSTSPKRCQHTHCVCYHTHTSHTALVTSSLRAIPLASAVSTGARGSTAACGLRAK